MLRVQLEDLVLGIRLPAVGAEHHVHRRIRVAVLVPYPRADLEQERGSGDAQGVRRSRQRPGWRTGRAQHAVQHSRRIDAPLESGAAQGVREIRSAQLVQHGDNPVAPEVRRITQRRTPVAVSDPGVLV